jgi:hypothetical protein
MNLMIADAAVSLLMKTTMTAMAASIADEPEMAERVPGRHASVSPFTWEKNTMTRGLGGHSPANVTYHLKGIDFPASKQNLLQQAEDNGADSDVLEVIETMPDADYGSMADVMKAYGETNTGPSGRSNDGGGSRRLRH